MFPRKPSLKSRLLAITVASCVVGLLLVMGSAQCGGKRASVDASVEGAGNDAGEAAIDGEVGYCTWIAYDGTHVECAVGPVYCKGPPGPNWCDRCGCIDPVTNRYECTGEPCAPEPP